jgi:hypothetical protein
MNVSGPVFHHDQYGRASSVIKYLFVAMQRCRVQACPKNRRTEQRDRKEWEAIKKTPAGEGGFGRRQ